MYMRIAVVSSDGKVNAMDDGSYAIILDAEKQIGSIKLGEYEEHPGLQKMMEIIRNEPDIDAIITSSCGPPCFSLAKNKGKTIYFFNGNIEEMVEELKNGNLKPVSEEEVMRVHSRHRHAHHER